MSTPFAMVGDADAGICVDGVCAVPSPPQDARDDVVTSADRPADVAEPTRGTTR